MPYNNGVLIADPGDAIDQISAMASANGWTIHHDGVDNGDGDPANENYRKRVLALGNGTFDYTVSFRGITDGTAVAVSAATNAYNSGASIHGQGGAVQYTNYLVTSGTICHVFAQPSSIYVVMESPTKSYRHFGFGELVKNDAYDGGSFYTTQYSTSSGSTLKHIFPFQSVAPYNYVGVGTLAVLWGGDGYSRRFHYNESSKYFPDSCRGSTCHSSTATDGIVQDLVDSCSNQFNRQSVLFPIHCFVDRAGDVYSPVGHPPEVRAVNCRFIDDGAEVLLGDDVWKVFPIGEKLSASNAFNSQNSGLAYRVI